MKNADLGSELDAIKTEYLNPTPDRIVDQSVMALIAEYAVSRVPPGKQVLELGVGDQVWTPMLFSKFEEVTSVDASQGLLDDMLTRLPGKAWTPVCKFFEDYEPEQRFDAVFATFVLEHVDDHRIVLERARQKWLKPGGRLIVVVPHALSLHRRLAVKMGLSLHPAQLGDTDRRLGHKRCLTYYEMARDVVDAGFSIVESRGMTCKPLPNGLLAHLSDAQLKGLFELGLDLPIEYAGTIYIQAQSR